MSVYIPIEVACDGRDKGTYKSCAATAPARLKLLLKGEKGKLRGELELPADWCEKDDYDGQTEYFCPVHGPVKVPWRYGT